MNRLSPDVDVHQHLWPESVVAALRARTRPPRLRGWTLELAGEPAFAVDPDDHDVGARAALATDDALGTAVVSLSSALGIETLPGDDARELLEAWHEGASSLPAPFTAWAAASLRPVDPDAVAAALDRGCVGLQLPADVLADRAGYEHVAPLLDLLEERGRPLLVHPGPAPAGSSEGPAWWPAMVAYVQQMHASWFAWRIYGRPRHPRLRVCFAMLAGLAPLHAERFAARAHERSPVDAGVFLDVFFYGPRAVDAVVRVVGVDPLVHGSDRPYAPPPELDLGDAVAYAVRAANPRRLLEPPGDAP